MQARTIPDPETGPQQSGHVVERVSSARPRRADVVGSAFNMAGAATSKENAAWHMKT